MKIKGNKGEWSEFYAFVKLLSIGKLYAANDKVEKIDDIFFPIIKILRNENKKEEKEYVISFDDGSVEIYCDIGILNKISNVDLIRISEYLYKSIVNGNSRSFEIVGSDEIMEKLHCERISAPSIEKADIKMQIHDIYTGYNPICGFSIKSEIGSPPTLLNASKATNFIFEVKGLNDKQLNFINEINTKSKIIDRIEKILEFGKIKYKNMSNDNFYDNLLLIDTYMDSILAEILIDYYKNNIQDCKSLIERIEERNPLGYPRKGIYEYKFKKLLCSVALGMKPSIEWDGHDEANGGYIIVKEDGDVVAYHIYNRDSFEKYLLNNTKLEKGSTTKHDFAHIYYGENKNMYINLNLQIRFIK